MILVDYQINQLCKGIVPHQIRRFYGSFGVNVSDFCLPMVEPFNPDLVNPASLDIRIGETAKVKTLTGYKDINLNDFPEDNPYWLSPGDRVLVASLETFNLPPFVSAQFVLKSSRAREWYGHQLAGYCDPGWHGSKLTMEITNDNNELLPFYKKLKIGQMVFKLTMGLPEADYGVTGRYNKDSTVSGSKG